MQNIALNIVLNGVPQAISNLTQFEEVLIAARSQLSQLEIGSVAFKKLSGEIKTADNSLRQLKKQTEGKDLEGRLGDFGKLGGAIGSSFAAATAAIQLFGDGSEDSLKAVTAAQNALTIAFAARGVAEGVVVVENIALEISNYATAKSQLYLNTVTKAFYATLAANPYTAILVGVGLLITAFIGLTSATDDAKKAQKEFNDALTKDIAKEQSSFRSLQRTIENTNLSYETRKDALDKLREQFPKYFENLKDEDLLNGKVKISYDKLADAIRSAAQARALEGRIATRAEQLLNLTDREAELQKQITKELKNQKELKGVIFQGGQTAGGFGAAGNVRAATETKIVGLQDEQKSIQKEINNLKALDLKDSKAISDIQNQVEPVMGKIAGNEKEITKEKEKQEVLNVKQLEIDRLRLEASDRQKATLQAIFDFQSVSQPTILKNQEQEINNLKQIETILQGIIAGSPLSDVFSPLDTDKEYKDVFKTIVDGSLTAIKNIDKFPTSIEKIKEQFNDINFDVFSAEQQKDIVLYFNTIDAGIKAIGKLKFGEKQLDNSKAQLLIEKQITESRVLQAQVDKGEFTQSVANLKLRESLSKEIITQLGLEEEFTKFALAQTDEQKKTYQAFLDSKEEYQGLISVINTSLATILKFNTEVTDSGKKINENTEEYKKKLQEVKRLLKTLNEEEFKQFLQATGYDFQSALTEGVRNAKKIVEIGGKEALQKWLDATDKLPIEFEKMTIKQLKTLKSTLKLAGEELDEYGINVTETFDNTISGVEKSIKEKVIGNILDALQEVQAVLNTLSQTTSAYYNAQFDVLEKRNKRITEGIVGDSVAANKKRIEAEKSYQAQRAKLEKQAAKTSLRISLAQSAANTAEAITKAVAVYGPTPGSFVAAALVAALSAVQTGIIATQLANIDSYRSGGMLKRQGGGMVFGPSHENGGIRFQGGGMELEGNESVINRVSTVNYMGLLSQINQAGGGRPIGPGYDDSRIVEAIAKQRNTPIRAYVVESDITAKQETARRLEKLSQI
jgi:hypothetical protein